MLAALGETSRSVDVDTALDQMIGAVRPLGFSAVAYDYSPVPVSHDGSLLMPTVLRFRAAPPEMEGLWREGSYYRMDPVQDAALLVSRPFLWSYIGRQSDVMVRVLHDRHDPVVGYLRDTRLTLGITVPIRLAGGDLATFTVMCRDPDPSDVPDAERVLGDVSLMGHAFHETVYPGFSRGQRTCAHIRLSPRERQCLGLCAEGLGTKEIAYRIGRSQPTVMLHLASATRKLGARNRLQAVARAAHYRLLEADN